MVTVAGDITAADAAERIAIALQAEFGRLDVLVNNAGGWVGDVLGGGERQKQVGQHTTKQTTSTWLSAAGTAENAPSFTQADVAGQHQAHQAAGGGCF